MTATETATGALLLALAAGVAGVTAEAGNAREATMAPEMMITAEALPAGLTEREIADAESAAAECADRLDEAELRGLGAR